MEQSIYRAALLVCCMLSIGVLANVFVLQGRQPKLAMSSPGYSSTNRSRPSQPGAVNGAATRSRAGRRAPATVASPDLVRAIQRELYASGYAVRAPDGALDMATRAAILAWEQRNGVALTAEPSEDLLKALLLGAVIDPRPRTSKPTPAVAMLVQHIQILLKSRKFGAIEINGRIDQPTRRAIAKFERAQGMKASGVISGALVVRLESAGRHGR